MSRVGCIVIVLLAAAPALAAKPTPEEIRKGVKDLGDPNFAVRERATKLLWEAGADAEEALRAATTSGNAEVASRARSLLQKFDWGIFPDTPAQIVEQINVFRNGDRSARLQAVSRLMTLGKPGYATVKRLAEMEQNPGDRQALFAHIAQEAQHALPSLLAAGDVPAVEDLLDRCLLAGTEEAFTSYAAFQTVTGQLPAALARWEQDWTKSKSTTAGSVLVHLLRAKGDFVRARDVALKLKNDTLADEVLWEQGNWGELARRMNASTAEVRDAAGLGVRAAVFRLAADRAAFDTTIAKLVKLAEGDDRFEVRSAAEALLINGRHDDALRILLARKMVPSLAFDLLVAQLRFKEALEFAEAAKPDEKEERFRLGLRRARALYMLGRRDQALAQFAEQGLGLKEAAELSWARDLVRTMARLNLKDQATEQAARYLDFLVRQDVRDGWEDVLDPLFGNDADIAAIWWRYLRGRFGGNPVEAIRAVRRVLDGPAPPELNEWAAAVAELASAREGQSAPPAFAAASALLRHGRDAKGREFVDKAIAQQPDASVPLRYADHLAKRGQGKEAAEWYGKAAKLAPSNALAVFLQGNALRQAGDEKEGRRLIELAHRMPLGSEAERGKFAEDLHDRGFFDDAKRECDLVLTFGWHRYGHLGRVLNLASRYGDRASDYKRAAELLERSLAGMLRYGMSFVDRGHYLHAPQAVRKFRAQALLAENKVDEALGEVKAVLAALPGDLEPVIAAMPALERAGRKTDADALYTSVAKRYDDLIRDFPDSAFAHNGRAWLAVACGRDLDTALTHAHAAVKLEPLADTCLDTLAEAHFRRGDTAKAIEIMKKCRELRPDRTYFAKQLARFTKGDRSAPIPRDD